MKPKDELIQKLKTEYFLIVKNGINLQKSGDIKAFKLNAIKAEKIAQKIQFYSKAN